MDQPDLTEANPVKRFDPFGTSALPLDDLPDLPLGIVLYQPVREATGAIRNLAITYYNAFAASLFGCVPSSEEPVFLTEIPRLRTLFESACRVLETGVSTSEAVYESEKESWISSSIARKDDGGVIYLQIDAPIRKSQRTLQRRQELEAIVSGISIRLSNLPSPEVAAYLAESLAQIGQYTLADRAYIYTYSPDGLSNSCTYEWCAGGVEPQQPLFQNQLNSQFPWWHQKMMQQETISLHHPDELPTSATGERESLNQQGIQSLLVVPMVFDTKLTGFMGFGMVHQHRYWNEHDIDLLKIYSSLVVSAINRLDNEERLERINKRLEGLNKISNALINSHLLEEPADLAALKDLYRMIPCEVGIVFRIDPTGQFACTDNRVRRGVREFWPNIRFPVNYLYNRKLAHGKASLINHLRPDNNGMPAALNPYHWGHRSFMAVPLFAHQHYVGLLVLLDKSPAFFTEEHLLIAQEVAGQLSILLLQEEASQKINESNQLLQGVVDNIPVGLGLWQPIREEGRIVDFSHLLTNTEYTTLTGLGQPEAAQPSLLTLSPMVQQNGLFDKLVEVAETGRPQQVQLQNNTPKGELWSDVSIVRVGDTVLFTAKDITSLKYVEGQLRQTNAELEERVIERAAQIQQLSTMQQAILTYAGLAITATDMEGTIKLVNPALEAISGYSAHELVGKVTPGFIGQPRIFGSQSDPQPISAYIEKYGFIQQEDTIVTREGNKIPVLSTTSGLYNDQNNLTGYVNFATDISYLKHIEKELTQANQRIQLATTAGNLGVWEWNLQTDELTLDKNFYTVFELPDNVVMNKFTDLAALILPDDFAYFSQNVKHTIRDNKRLYVEFRIFSPLDKSIHYMKADGIVLQDEITSGFRVVGIVSDRTAQKKAIQALRESKKRYRSLVDHLKNVVFHIDINGLFSYLNSSWQTITGFRVKETLGRPLLDFVHPDDRAHNQYLHQQLMNRQHPHYEHTVRYICRERGYCWMSVFAHAMVDEDNQITGVTGTMTDITERKKAEEALQESEQRFRDIAENVDEIFWIRDLHDPRFIYMNSAYERFTGQHPQALYKNPLLFLTFILEEDQRKVLDAFTRLGSETDVRFRATHQDGSVHWMEIRGFVVKDDTGAVIRRIGMATDITLAIEKELILEEALKNERNLNYLKSQFISTASHEFRTPLATISSSVELLKHYANSGNQAPDTSINKHIHNIFREVFTLSELITNTLTISKIEEKKATIKLERIDLIALCETILKDHFSERADNRHSELIIVGNPVSVLIDPNLIRHVVTNLLTNAPPFLVGCQNLLVSHCQISGQQKQFTYRPIFVGKDVATDRYGCCHRANEDGQNGAWLEF